MRNRLICSFFPFLCVFFKMLTMLIYACSKLKSKYVCEVLLLCFFMHLFVNWLIHKSFLPSFIYSLIHSFFHLVHSFIRLFIIHSTFLRIDGVENIVIVIMHWFIDSVCFSKLHVYVHSFIQLLVYICTYLFIFFLSFFMDVFNCLCVINLIVNFFWLT